MNIPNLSHEEINRLEKKVYDVIVKELGEKNLSYKVQVRIYDNVRTTGVQGDDRTYCPLVEITLLEKGRVVYDEKLVQQISTEITNNVKGTNRVVVTVPHMIKRNKN